MASQLGEGFRFSPKEDELITYLADKVSGSQSLASDDWIKTDDLYGDKEPWDIFKDSGERELYFFTELKKVAGNTKSSSWRGQRISRNVGAGFWSNKGQKDPIFGRKRGQIIGHKRSFRYERRKKGGGGGKGKWILKEYTLPDSARVKEEFRDYALCVLKRKDDGGGRKNHPDCPDVEIGFEEMMELILKKQQPAVPPGCGGGGGDEEEEDWAQMIDWGNFDCDNVGFGKEGSKVDWNVPGGGGGDFGIDQEEAGGGDFGIELQQGNDVTRISACSVEEEGALLGGGGVDDYFNLNRRLSGAHHQLFCDLLCI